MSAELRTQLELIKLTYPKLQDTFTRAQVYRLIDRAINTASESEKAEEMQ